MHKYLNAIGYGGLASEKQLNRLLQYAEKVYTHHELMALDQETDYCEYRMKSSKDMGICVCGTMDEEEHFERYFYYPYFEGSGITSVADVTLERRMDRHSFVGIYEDAKVGVSLIFHVQNAIECMLADVHRNHVLDHVSITLSGLCNDGMILLPVFKNPDQVMDNIFGVTEYLRNIIRQEGGDLDREALSYIKTKSGETYFEDDNGQPWRCLHYVANSICHQQVERPEQFYQSALSFGHFLKQLGDYPAESLYETIPQFHDTVKRLRDFKDAQRKDVKNRARKCKPEIEFVLSREDDCGVLMKQLEEGKLPLRVTHNDTKLNNILFDADTDEGLCIIDLDTIMPGLAANDFGDSIRFGASTAEEDEPDLDKVHFDINLYDIYTKGYLEMAKDVLTPAEIASLPWGARLMTLECGMRFLADYLQGDVYFKTAYPEHNLVRARTQFRLVKEMEEQFDQMNEILKKYI